ncbi:MAG: hypothetical protein ACK56I_05795, partial [bacterium]
DAKCALFYTRRGGAECLKRGEGMGKGVKKSLIWRFPWQGYNSGPTPLPPPPVPEKFLYDANPLCQTKDEG